MTEFSDRSEINSYAELAEIPPVPLPEFLVSADRHELASWLLRSFETWNFEPLVLRSDPSPESQLEYMYDVAGPDERHKIRLAVWEAISMWRVDTSSIETLLPLAFLASAIGAPGYATQLSRILDTPEFRNARVPDLDRTLSKILGVIGAAGDPEVFDFLRRGLIDGSLSPDLAAQLMMGIAASRPQSYHEYIPYFFEQAKHASIKFDFHHIAEGIAFYVHDALLVEKLPLVPMPYFEQFLELLAVPPDAAGHDCERREPYFRISRERNFELISRTKITYQLNIWDGELRDSVSDVWTRQLRASGELAFA